MAQKRWSKGKGKKSGQFRKSARPDDIASDESQLSLDISRKASGPPQTPAPRSLGRRLWEVFSRKASGPPQTPAPATQLRTDDCDWEKFGQHEYVERNYGEALDADLEIIEKLASFYESTPSGGDHIEIGAGPNLYPLMAAAKHRDSVHVTDVGASNLEYVQSEMTRGLGDVWHRWHGRLRDVGGGYDTNDEMVERLREVCTYEQMSVLDIPDNSYDSSSMMFVAESMTNDYDEFATALQRSVRCVRPGGSFSVALMLNSQGYNAGDEEFPAVPVTPDDVKAIIGPEASEAEYSEIDFNVREGHEGMLLVTGRR